MEMKFEFGDQLKDAITGFRGTAIGYCTYITGCNQYLLVPKVNKVNDKRPDGEWFDEDRLMKVKDSKKINLPAIGKISASTGPDKEAPKR